MHKGWVISRRGDLLAFWFPLAIASLTLIPGAPTINSSFALFVLMVVPVDAGHVMATFFPARDRILNDRLRLATALAILAVVITLSLSIFYYSRALFFSMLGLLSLVHVMRQQYGWIMVSCRKLGQKRAERFWDRLLIWNLMLFPALWWLSPECRIDKTYFVAHDLAFLQHLIPQLVAKAGLVVHWIVLAAWLAHAAWRRAAIPAPKLSLFLSTWIWFYGGLVLAESYAFFFTAGLLSHGLSYMLFSFHTTRKSSSRGALDFLIAVQVAAAAWALGIYSLEMADGFNPESLWIPVLRSLTLAHVVFDSFMWRAPWFGYSKFAQIQRDTRTGSAESECAGCSPWQPLERL